MFCVMIRQVRTMFWLVDWWLLLVMIFFALILLGYFKLLALETIPEIRIQGNLLHRSLSHPPIDGKLATLIFLFQFADFVLRVAHKLLLIQIRSVLVELRTLQLAWLPKLVFKALLARLMFVVGIVIRFW